MLDIILSQFETKFKVTECESREQKVGPMKFEMQAYDVAGVGRLSVMKGVGGPFGIMQMDTLMLTPALKDMPLISYDRIYVRKNDTLIIEMYNTCLEAKEYPELAAIKEKYSSIPDRDPGQHWYDSIKCPESLSKKGKKITSYIDVCAEEFIEKYISLLKAAPVVDAAEKQKKNGEYVEGLLNQGGPSTDQFVKAIGREETEKLYREFLFGTDKVNY